MAARMRLVCLAILVAGCTPLAGRSDPPDVTPIPVATASPSPSGASASSTASSDSLTPTVEPTPSADPDPGALELEVTSCTGGVVLEWSPSIHPAFHHYTALRSSDPEIATAYPPIAPAVDWGDTYATDRFVTSAVDASILPSPRRWHYRVMAYDEAGRVVGSSPVRSARIRPVDEIGPLTVASIPGEGSLVRWSAYSGFSGCFSSYQLLAGSGVPRSMLAVVDDIATTEATVDALHPGMTYALKVQAIRVTTLGSFVVGESETIVYTVPGG
jgi:hypothetical protein